MEEGLRGRFWPQIVRLVVNSLLIALPIPKRPLHCAFPVVRGDRWKPLSAYLGTPPELVQAVKRGIVSVECHGYLKTSDGPMQ